MFDNERYNNEKKNILSLKDLIKILDDLKNFENKYKVNLNQAGITGGDLLLRPDWKEFFQELKTRKILISIADNPDTLTEKNVSFLAQCKIEFFTLSLDGLEDFHDNFRYKGSFKQIIEKTKLLTDYGIRHGISFTLFPDNKDQLIPLIKYLSQKTSVELFSFDFGCYVGNAVNLNKTFKPSDIFKLFDEYYNERINLINEKSKLRLGVRSNLFKLLRFEKNNFFPINTSTNPVVSGCEAAWSYFIILSDGTVAPCRRMPVSCGKMPEQTLEEIFLGSELFKKLRRKKYFENCGNCDFYKFCRGCPAYVNSISNSPFKENPLCFKKLISRNEQIQNNNISEPDLNTTYTQEFDWLMRRTSTSFFAKLQELSQNNEFQEQFLKLSNSKIDKKLFIKNPFDYIKKQNILVSDDILIYLYFYFSTVEEISPIYKEKISKILLRKFLINNF